MKLSSLGLASTVLAGSLNIPFIDHQFNLPQLSLSALSEAKHLWGLLEQNTGIVSEEAIPHELKEAWKELLETYSKDYLNEKIIEFNSKAGPKSKVQTVNFDRLDASKYDFVNNAKYPDHQIRISKSNPASLGIDSVKQTTGYLDFKDNHLFYYFFESRNDPANDPVILWLNGGPGCSSMTGLFFELGPSSLGPELIPIHNPYSWNNNASVIFLEQPVGVGYSYGDEKVSTSYAAARDVFVFLELFFQKFPQFVKNDFHIAGESYAGHYIPAIASEIVNHADRSFDLTSVLIGNGITDSLIQDAYYQPMACGLGGYKKVLTDKECDQMTKDYPKCKKLVQACYATRNAFACVPAGTYCSSKMLVPFEKTGLNVYDIRAPCETEESLCYKEMGYIEQYLNKPEIQEALGSDVDSYTGCSNDVGVSFAFTGDESKPFQYFVAELLDKHIPVLIYAGDKDFICNWLGNRAWSDALEWEHGETYRNKVLQPWYNGDKQVGEVKSFGNFTFLRVFDAGHMVPFNQPEASLNMVNSWIAGDYSFST